MDKYRDQVSSALGKCVRYDITHEADFYQTSYIGKGIYSAKTYVKAIASFVPAKIGDPRRRRQGYGGSKAAIQGM